MPVLPRVPPSKRDLPALHLSADRLLSTGERLTSDEAAAAGSKRALPPLSIDSDALFAPLALLGPPKAAPPSKRQWPSFFPSLSISSDALLAPLERLAPKPKPTTWKRNLPPLSLSSDAILAPLRQQGAQEEEASMSKRAGGSEDVFDKISVKRLQSNPPQSSASKRDTPHSGLSSASLLDNVPVVGRPLLRGEEETPNTKRDASPLLKLDSEQVMNSLPLSKLGLERLQSSPPPSAPPTKRENEASKPPPFVQVNSLKFLDKLSRVDVLHPLDPPPPASKRNEDSAEDREGPPVVGVNTQQFTDKLKRKTGVDPDPLHRNKALYLRQANTILIPAQYAGIDSGPSPGAVAGIVLGSVAGFLLIVWLLWLISNGGGVLRSSTYVEDDIVVSRHRSRSPGTRRSHRSHRTEMTSRSPRRERVIRQERIVRDRSMPARETSRLRDTVIMDEQIRPERRVEGDDIVEVIEEHSSVSVPPPRRSKGRQSSSGYR
ncbi:uncharacterized protein RCC_00449 [Ramularia collo-cygni]|nr:uncharacterized protein RCC_00449 [Ramularia collo-cygni]CZT14471.1 uncharacterized protein RCC_00449 [Ramularia collo-cygni]